MITNIHHHRMMNQPHQPERTPFRLVGWLDCPSAYIFPLSLRFAHWALQYPERIFVLLSHNRAVPYFYIQKLIIFFAGSNCLLDLSNYRGNDMKVALKSVVFYCFILYEKKISTVSKHIKVELGER